MSVCATANAFQFPVPGNGTSLEQFPLPRIGMMLTFIHLPLSLHNQESVIIANHWSSTVRLTDTFSVLYHPTSMGWITGRMIECSPLSCSVLRMLTSMDIGLVAAYIPVCSLGHLRRSRYQADELISLNASGRSGYQHWWDGDTSSGKSLANSTRSANFPVCCTGWNEFE